MKTDIQIAQEAVMLPIKDVASAYGISEDDLELLWTAIINMFENDRSAARGKMCLRKLYVFKHDSALGNAPAHILFDKISIQRKENIQIPRKFEDYDIAIDRGMPSGVEFIEKI